MDRRKLNESTHEEDEPPSATGGYPVDRRRVLTAMGTLVAASTVAAVGSVSAAEDGYGASPYGNESYGDPVSDGSTDTPTSTSTATSTPTPTPTSTSTPSPTATSTPTSTPTSTSTPTPTDDGGDGSTAVPEILRLAAEDTSHPNNPHADLSIDWAASIAEGELRSALLTVSDSSGVILGWTYDLIGQSFRNSEFQRIKHGGGETYTVDLTVRSKHGTVQTAQTTFEAP